MVEGNTDGVCLSGCESFGLARAVRSTGVVQADCGSLKPGKMLSAFKCFSSLEWLKL